MYLMKYRARFETLSLQELNSFKKYHKEEYATLRNTLHTEIFLQNLNTSLAALLLKVEKNAINNDVYNILACLTNANPSFGKKGTLGSVSLNKLKQLLTVFVSTYYFCPNI